MNGAVLNNVNLTNATMTNARFLGETNMTNATLIGVRSGGVQGAPALPAAYRLSGGFIIGPEVDLGGANLAGVDFTDFRGNGQSLSLDNDLKLHLIDRPTTQIDLRLGVKLDGNFDGSAFDGSGQIGIGIRGRF